MVDFRVPAPGGERRGGGRLGRDGRDGTEVGEVAYGEGARGYMERGRGRWWRQRRVEVGIGGGNAGRPDEWMMNGVVGRSHRRCTFFSVHGDALHLSLSLGIAAPDRAIASDLLTSSCRSGIAPRLARAADFLASVNMKDCCLVRMVCLRLSPRTATERSSLGVTAQD